MEEKRKQKVEKKGGKTRGKKEERKEGRKKGRKEGRKEGREYVLKSLMSWSASQSHLVFSEFITSASLSTSDSASRAKPSVAELQ